MSDLLPILLSVTLLMSGVAAGVLLWSVIGGVPLLLSLPAERYVETHQFWGSRFDGLQPLLVTATLVADVVLAVAAPNALTKSLFVVGAATALGVIVISKFRNVPLKRRVMRLDPHNLPPDWEQTDPRREWAAWNLGRTVCGLVAFAANVAVVALLP
ncbi:putative membrane protein [Kibdelosporangium banguiense]|uniref:Membrane protein n=1 Tax=Kibdelosporangium banguiense TaxID=1365924 RepID=A0ABS4TFG7_9PSEU|nr:DUF1772 domain-containing protein [Kibdelosporangium banguiense]MBP2323145.1 putative membrane protein [Kibdelosporangium banguiense]